MAAQDFDLRSRYLDVDDRLVELKTLMEEASFSMADFREKFDMSWIYHDCGLEGIVLSYHEIKAAIDRKVASDNHLLPTYTIIKNLKAGYFKYGASSITMQTVKNVLLYREKTLSRKLHPRSSASRMGVAARASSPYRPRRGRNSGSTARAPRQSRGTRTRSRSTRMS